MSNYTVSEKEIVIGLVKRFLQCTRNEYVYFCGMNIDGDDRYIANHSIDIMQVLGQPLHRQIIFACDAISQEVLTKVYECYSKDNYIVVIHTTDSKKGYPLGVNKSDKSISFLGLADSSAIIKPRSDFKVLAIIHMYNEEDVIEKTSRYLLNQGIDLFLVDNWSTDNTATIANRLVAEHPDRVHFELFPKSGKNDFYDWYHQLERTEQITQQYHYDWYIHYDADEYRITPWDGITLKEMIYWADVLGFNAIENTIVEFKLTEKGGNSIFMEDTWFDFGHRTAHFEQTKTWKRDISVDLKNSGGHIAVINDPKIFPFKILNRHYPLRSDEQAKKKIFTERLPRFQKENKERGWHGHYEKIHSDKDFIYSKDELILWSSDTKKKMFVSLFTGCGVWREEESPQYSVDIEIEEENLALYGAGKVGSFLYHLLSKRVYISHWVDKNYKRIEAKEGRVIESPSVVYEGKEKILIAVENADLVNEITEELLSKGVKEERIVWINVKKK